MSDIYKYLTKHCNISSTLVNSHIKANTPHIIDSQNGLVDIYSKLIDNRIIFLASEMESDICNIIKAQLLYLEAQSNADIKIYIDSPGGSVYSGLGVIDTMEYITPDIITINTGLAASMAAVVLCCGTNGKRKSLKRSRTMIHQPLTGGFDIVQASDMEIDAKEINLIKKELCELISSKTNHSVKKVTKDCDRDYWMSSADALKYGLIDSIVI